MLEQHQCTVLVRVELALKQLDDVSVACVVDQRKSSNGFCLCWEPVSVVVNDRLDDAKSACSLAADEFDDTLPRIECFHEIEVMLNTHMLAGSDRQRVDDVRHGEFGAR